MKNSLLIIVGLFLGLIILSPAEIIKEIRIEGAQSDETEEKLREEISISVGQELSTAPFALDLKAIFKTGLVDDAWVEVKEIPEGVIVIYGVKERPEIEKIIFKGTRHLKEAKLREKLSVKEKDRFWEAKVKKTLVEIKKLYQEKGFYLAKARFEPILKKGKVTLVYYIKEGKRVKIVEIDIIGNKGIGERKIKSLMETKTAGFFSRGVFNEEKLKTDLEKIISYYKNHGYPEIEIKNWRIDFNRDKSKMFLLLEIAEGPFYRFGKVGVTGNKLFSSSELTQVLKAKEGKPYSQEKTERDKMMITTKYLNKGYLGCEVIPEVTFKKEQGAVNITYKITEGDVYSIDNIYIRGNTYTKEKVIRRELEFKEGEILDYSKIMKSIYKLYQLGYFSSVDREIRPSVEPNKVDVIIEVKEREQRRWLNLGASYSQVDKLVFFLEVNWDNLFGAGKKLYIKTEGGAEKLQGEVGFVEPYLFDKPIYSKIRAYLLKKDYEFYEEIYGKEKNVVGKVAYDTTERGCELTSGWEIVTFHRLYTTYEIKKTTYRLIPLPPETLEPKLPSKVGGKEVRWPEGAKEKTRQEYQKILKETFGEENYQKYYHEYQKWRNNWESWNREHNKFYTLEGNPFWKHRAYHPGSYVARNFFWKDGGVIEKKEVHPLTSSISNAYVWDTYNDPYNTTQGFRLRLYNKIAGLGGDEHFIKNSVSFGVYFPLKFGLVLGFYFDFGVIKGYNRKDVPPLERYWLGGANTVRGYAEYELGRGFRSRFFSNIELKLPLEDGAITPLIFFDAGAGWCAQEEAPQSWREIFNQVDFQKLRFGTGVELRIRTPAVPLRIGFGWKLGPLKKGQSRTQLHFSMGQMF